MRIYDEAERINDDIDGEALSVLVDIAHGGMLAAHYQDDPAADSLAWLHKRGCVGVAQDGLLKITPVGRLVLDCADVLG